MGRRIVSRERLSDSRSNSCLHVACKSKRIGHIKCKERRISSPNLCLHVACKVYIRRINSIKWSRLNPITFTSNTPSSSSFFFVRRKWFSLFAKSIVESALNSYTEGMKGRRRCNWVTRKRHTIIVLQLK